MYIAPVLPKAHRPTRPRAHAPVAYWPALISRSRRRFDCTANSRTAETRYSTSARATRPVVASRLQSRTMAST